MVGCVELFVVYPDDFSSWLLTLQNIFCMIEGGLHKSLPPRNVSLTEQPVLSVLNVLVDE